MEFLNFGLKELHFLLVILESLVVEGLLEYGGGKSWGVDGGVGLLEAVSDLFLEHFESDLFLLELHFHV